jgi:hypothetical protein
MVPGGRFRFLEMMYSGSPPSQAEQDFFAPFVEKVHGARFDRDTLRYVKEAEKLLVTGTRVLKVSQARYLSPHRGRPGGVDIAEVTV